MKASLGLIGILGFSCTPSESNIVQDTTSSSSQETYTTNGSGGNITTSTSISETTTQLSTSTDTISTDSASTSENTGGTMETAPVRYPADALVSPINEFVANQMRAIQQLDPTTDEHVFMKVGASGTVSTHFLYCFAGNSQPDYVLDLEGRDELQATIDYFRLGDANGSTPFDRPTYAAETGKTAEWVMSGDPSPIEMEINAIHPRFAFINYGTNDMNMGTTHASALRPFFEDFNALLDLVSEQGIVPIVTGLNPRSDSTDAMHWVPTYNAVTRGIAETRQIPFINLYLASVNLEDMGLLNDGVHGNVYYDNTDSAQPCIFNSDGLDYNYNNRNLLSIQTLDTAKRTVNDNESAPDTESTPISGSGTSLDPYVVDSLPFTHAGNTSLSSESSLNFYSGCASTSDESGPEVIYMLQVTEPQSVRFVVLDREGVDIDIHLLSDTISEDACIERNDGIIDTMLDVGTYYIAVDTYVSSGIAQSGEYLFVAINCETGDEDCDL